MLKKSLPNRGPPNPQEETCSPLTWTRSSRRLRRLGYANSTVRELRLLRDLARWLRRRDLALAHLHEPVANQFLEGRRREGRLEKR